jgi:hypothetical protein
MSRDEELLADAWRRTRATLALKFLEIPDTIEFQIDGANHIRATRFATLDELAKAIAALDKRLTAEARVRRASLTYIAVSRWRSKGTRWRSF